MRTWYDASPSTEHKIEHMSTLRYVALDIITKHKHTTRASPPQMKCGFSKNQFILNVFRWLNNPMGKNSIGKHSRRAVIRVVGPRHTQSSIFLIFSGVLNFPHTQFKLFIWFFLSLFFVMLWWYIIHNKLRIGYVLVHEIQ